MQVLILYTETEVTHIATMIRLGYISTPCCRSQVPGDMQERMFKNVKFSLFRYLNLPMRQMSSNYGL
jgi:hypothetical protein